MHLVTGHFASHAATEYPRVGRRLKKAPVQRPAATLRTQRDTLDCSFSPLSRFQFDDYVENFELLARFRGLGPPEQIAFYSYFTNDNNHYRFNDNSALRHICSFGQSTSAIPLPSNRSVMGF